MVTGHYRYLPLYDWQFTIIIITVNNRWVTISYHISIRRIDFPYISHTMFKIIMLRQSKCYGSKFKLNTVLFIINYVVSCLFLLKHCLQWHICTSCITALYGSSISNFFHYKIYSTKFLSSSSGLGSKQSSWCVFHFVVRKLDSAVQKLMNWGQSKWRV